MAEDYDFDDDDGGDEQPSESKDIRQLRKKAERVDKAEARATSAERRLTMMQAGINIDSPTGKLFAKAYDGDADLEQIRSAAEEYGLLEPPAPPVADEEIAAQQRMANASSGADASLNEDWDAQYAKATTPEEVMAVAQKRGTRTSWGQQ